MNDFFAKLFELWGGNISILSDDLYTYGIYSTIGMIMILICLAVPFVYYKVWDPVAFNKPSHWGIVMIISVVVTTLIGFLYAFNQFNYEELGYDFGQYLNWIVTLFLYSSLFITLFSLFGFRYISTNNRKNPF